MSVPQSTQTQGTETQSTQTQSTQTQDTETTTSGSPQSRTSGSPQSRTSGSPQSRTSGSPLKVHHLRPAPGAKKAKTRVGRGEASKGKTAGRGTKGSAARYQVPAGFEGGQMPLHMRLPKLKGFKNRFRTSYQVVNLDRIGSLFPDGGAIGVDELVEAGAVRDGELVKVLGQGEIGVAVQVRAHAFSASAVSKIESAGGTTTVL